MDVGAPGRRKLRMSCRCVAVSCLLLGHDSFAYGGASCSYEGEIMGESLWGRNAKCEGACGVRCVCEYDACVNMRLCSDAL